MGKVKSNTDERYIRFCTTCKKRHPITEDGFEYLDCILELRREKRKNDS